MRFSDHVEKPKTPEVEELKRALDEYDLQGDWSVDRHSHLVGAHEGKSGDIVFAGEDESAATFAARVARKDWWLAGHNFDPQEPEIEDGIFAIDPNTDELVKISDLPEPQKRGGVHFYDLDDPEFWKGR